MVVIRAAQRPLRGQSRCPEPRRRQYGSLARPGQPLPP